MNTHSHGFFTYAALQGHPDVGMAVFGSMMPDLPFAFGYPFFAGRDGISHDTWVSNKTSPIIKTAVAITHSFVTWFFATLVILVFAPQLGMLAWGWLAHIGIDFCTHNHAAHAHFYPFSNWRFRSPISFYEKNYYGRHFIAVEHTAMVLFLALWTWQDKVGGAVQQLAGFWQGGAMAVTYVLLLALAGLAFRLQQQGQEPEPALVPAEIPVESR